jgi:DNA-directed RNA polymerase specialized sigma24 family protein
MARHLGEDGTQFAFLKATGRVGRTGFFASNVHFVRWLTKVAYRHALRQSQRARPKPLPPADQLESPTVGPSGTSPEVRTCLNQVAPEERRVLLLYYYHGLTDAEIGTLEFGHEAGSRSGLGQRARRVRRQGLQQLRQLLLAAELDPDSWQIQK